MRILYVSPYPPARDGIGTYTEAIVGELQALGHDTRVVVPRAEPVPSPVTLEVLRPRRAHLTALRNTVTAWQPDCIHLQFAVAAFGTRTLALLSWLRLMRATGIPVVVTMHEVTRDIALLHAAGRTLYRKVAASCDHVIVHTQAARKECVGAVRIPPRNVSVIPHPKATPPPRKVAESELRERFELGNSRLLLAFGFVHVDKGLTDLIRALCILRTSDIASLENLRLVIAGTVRPRTGIFRLFEFRDRLHLRRVLSIGRRGNVAQNVVLTGYVPDTEVAAWFHASAAVTLPYRRTEQSGVAALANAFGIPVLASTVGGLSELYSASRWTFPPRDPQAIARVLADFLTLSDNSLVDASAEPAGTELNSVVAATLDIYRSTVFHDGSGAKRT
jgi:glycosyltransferase involved in cell wall biosynthesis